MEFSCVCLALVACESWLLPGLVQFPSWGLWRGGLHQPALMCFVNHEDDLKSGIYFRRIECLRNRLHVEGPLQIFNSTSQLRAYSLPLAAEPFEQVPDGQCSVLQCAQGHN